MLNVANPRLWRTWLLLVIACWACAARTYGAGDLLLYQESTPRTVRGAVDHKQTASGTLDYDYYANGQLKDVVSSNPDGVNVGYLCRA